MTAVCVIATPRNTAAPTHSPVANMAVPPNVKMPTTNAATSRSAQVGSFLALPGGM
jgi:hypothetical protein